ncbi:type VI secretion system lipoprotein TssJ [Dongshaea marina]|uniref:type VI secretion system lipoprotein TssJ n=1 Tax=Dongshaea marina TaxID=2047966 RepID=UPI000D3E62F7|nr:type VI secretion system lipoprotein TssJ [Dongshaea marina]
MRRLMICVLGILLVGCSSGSKSSDPAANPVPVEHPDQIKWDWQPDAAKLTITSSKQLNLYDAQPHTLMLCIYQLSDIAAFNELTKSRKGLKTLLKCSSFSNSVTHSRRLFIQPSQSLQQTFARYKGSRFVTIVAGYSHLNSKNVIVSYEFPILHSTKGSLFWKKDQYLPGKLDMHLKLSEKDIQKARVPAN